MVGSFVVVHEWYMVRDGVGIRSVVGHSTHTKVEGGESTPRCDMYVYTSDAGPCTCKDRRDPWDLRVGG